MAMVMPELWSKCSNFSLLSAISHLRKYKYLIKWKNHESILEFGFGNGRNSSHSLIPILPGDYKEFIGSDVSEDMVAYAKKHCIIPRSKIIQMDITSKVPIEFHERFDHVFSFFVIHRLKQPRKAFKNIYNMLKPGGAMFVTFFERTTCDDMFLRLSQHPKWQHFGQEEMISPYFSKKCPQKEYETDLVAANFKDYIFNVENESYEFSSEEEFDNSLIAINSILPKIPKEDFKEYIKDYLEEKNRSEVFDITFQNGRKIISFNINILVIIARKSLNI